MINKQIAESKLEICRVYRYIDNCTATRENIESCEELIEDMTMNEFNIDEEWLRMIKND